jgi:CelD/BcsL family acetyltransferase involved in cellulose biosynthesis
VLLKSRRRPGWWFGYVRGGNRVGVTVREMGVAGAELVCDVDRAEALAPEWDALAVACGAPTSCPAWMLAWWRHLAPSSGLLRVIAVRRDRELIGVVPFWVDAARRSTQGVYRLLADDFSPRVMPVARPDSVWEVARSAASLLRNPELRPDRIELGPIPADSPWPVALRESWPDLLRPVAYRGELLMSPTIWLADRSFDDWLSERGARFRSNLRRYRRLFDEAGGSYRVTSPDTVAADIACFAALHASRWDGRDSRLVAIGDRLVAFLEDVAAPLLTQQRFRLMLLEIEGRAICADLWLAAGGEVTGINAGWDERHSRVSPPQLTLVKTLEDAFDRGERRVNLGWGTVGYKRKYTSGAFAISWQTLLPPGPQQIRTVPRALPGIAARRMTAAVKRALPDQHVSRLRVLRDRVGQ